MSEQAETPDFVPGRFRCIGTGEQVEVAGLAFEDKSHVGFTDSGGVWRLLPRDTFVRQFARVAGVAKGVKEANSR